MEDRIDDLLEMFKQAVEEFADWNPSPETFGAAVGMEEMLALLLDDMTTEQERRYEMLREKIE